MNFLKSHFKFNKQEQSGIFFLLLIIFILQISYIFLNIVPDKSEPDFFLEDKNQQVLVDSLKNLLRDNDTLKVYPFNPNFITDYKGYSLGMSTEEIDRLFSFRAENKFVNSAEEFQEVTLVSDSLLNKLSGYFKFPEWTQTKKAKTPKTQTSSQVVSNVTIMDINTATASDLKIIYGIGDKLSERIIKFRDRLGGFLVDEQLQDVYGLETEVIQRILQKFRVIQKPNVSLININEAPYKDLAEFIYIDSNLAINIVQYRESVGTIHSLDELLSIEGFPKERFARIKLYLQL